MIVFLVGMNEYYFSGIKKSDEVSISEEENCDELLISGVDGEFC